MATKRKRAGKPLPLGFTLISSGRPSPHPLARVPGFTLIPSAFTLIELLVVIAIIAVLAAILFPVFAQAREKARGLTCLSNSRQAGMGIAMYVQDNDETFPMNAYYAANGRWYIWTDVVEPYVKAGGNLFKADGLHKCPSHRLPTQDGHIGLHMDVFPGGRGPNDPVNYQLPYGVATLADIDAPAEKIGMLEKGVNDGWQSYLMFATWEWDWHDTVKTNGRIDPARDGMTVAVAKGDCDFPGDPNVQPLWDNWASCSMLPRFRHNGAANFIFLDGHAKTMPRGSVKWYKNIYVPVGQPRVWTRENWYPY
jgi:prepilin-type N-terminal cleavage/methylation domain-containing protein/prepilin-type processing-associated H-X9-DG protein